MAVLHSAHVLIVDCLLKAIARPGPASLTRSSYTYAISRDHMYLSATTGVL